MGARGVDAARSFLIDALAPTVRTDQAPRMGGSSCAPTSRRWFRLRSVRRRATTAACYGPWPGARSAAERCSSSAVRYALASSSMARTRDCAVQAATSRSRSGACPRMSWTTIIASHPRTMESDDTRRSCCSSVRRSFSGSTARSIQSTRRWPRLGPSAGGFVAVRATMRRPSGSHSWAWSYRVSTIAATRSAASVSGSNSASMSLPASAPWTRPGSVSRGSGSACRSCGVRHRLRQRSRPAWACARREGAAWWRPGSLFACDAVAPDARHGWG